MGSDTRNPRSLLTGLERFTHMLTDDSDATIGTDDALALALPANGHRRDTPQRLEQLFTTGNVSGGVLSRVVWSVWRNRPDGCTVDADTWRAMFTTVGYQLDGRPHQPPRLARRLYRGATAERRLGLSWTTNPGVAHHFARTRQAPGAGGQVWTAVVHPRRFLAEGSQEREYVLDATGVQVTAFDTSALPAWTEHPRWPHRLRGQ